MIFRTILSLFLILFVCNNTILAQPDQISEKYIPVSPDAAFNMKLIDTPVSLTTGIPSINIPIEVLKSEKLELPISLSYYAGGIKTNEEATCVGLGWKLNAGGMITRRVVGLPDDSGLGYWTVGKDYDYTDPDDVNNAGQHWVGSRT